MADSRIFGTLTRKGAEILRKVLQRFIAIGPDDEVVIDPPDWKHNANVKKIL